MPDYGKIIFKDQEPQDIIPLFQSHSSEKLSDRFEWIVQIMAKMLKYDRSHRMTSRQILEELDRMDEGKEVDMKPFY